ncbi:uncharacterized protein LOC100210922 isoform X2 [Hydra vulgaris]|uniref:uncharacterized protein LOC100210922 isoform X2 n=1 Tax=Hydra vulgaris TaxID=6087 RepID=UPI000641066B|nr:uncharacterized protein LOC100210922 isoform X4 [Hydra vulgaris]
MSKEVCCDQEDDHISQRLDRLEKRLNDLQQLFMSLSAITVEPPASTVVSSSAATVVPPASTALVASSAPTELTYENFIRYRTQNPGPHSNRSFLRWVEHGGQDRQNLSWNNNLPDQNAEDYWRRGSRRRRHYGRRERGGNIFICNIYM